MAVVLAQGIGKLVGSQRKGEASAQPLRIVKITEGRREEEILGDDPPVRYINQNSDSESTERLVCTRSFRQQCDIQMDKTTTTTTSLGAAYKMGVLTATAGVSVAQAIKQSYSITEETSRTFEQAVEVKVPPRSSLFVTLTWKRLWQMGNVSVESEGIVYEVPYRLLVGLAFDKRQDTVK